MIYKAAIFDMDGTLVNSIADIADGVNEMLEHYNFPNHTLDEIRLMVGNGARKLIERAIPADNAADKNFLQEALDYYNGCYAKRLTVKTRPYPGIPEMLKILKDKKISLAVCTNKQKFAADEMIYTLFPDIDFKKIVGDEPGKPKKPDPTRALEIAKKIGIKPKEVAYFGDTAVDMETAHNAGFLSIGVTWGFRPESELRESGAEIIIHKPLEIFDSINFDAGQSSVK